VCIGFSEGESPEVEGLCHNRWVSLANASHGPSAGDVVVLPFRVGGQAAPNALAKSRPLLLAQRHRVARGRVLAAQEGRPVVVEVAEDGRYVDSTLARTSTFCNPAVRKGSVLSKKFVREEGPSRLTPPTSQRPQHVLGTAVLAFG